MKRDTSIIEFEKVEYDVDVSRITKQPDILAISDFCYEGKHDNMCITYADAEAARKRAQSIKVWLKQNAYNTRYYVTQSCNKLYLIKERKKGHE